MRILHVVGARPNFMKVAPVVRALSRFPDSFEQLLVHTGQHYDEAMSQVFFDELDLPRPDVNLAVGSGSHSWQTAQIMLRFEPVLRDYRPDWILVPGDVNSTLACSLVAAKEGVRIAHLEAGLRSFDRTMPEELNRILTDQLADLLLTPSEDADRNLLHEGIPATKIRLVGNIMIDTLVRLLPAAADRWHGLRERFLLPERGFVLVTLHRPSNVDDEDRLPRLMEALNRIADRLPVLFPVHPRTRERLTRGRVATNAALRLCEPCGYLDFLALQSQAAVVVTDSGGIQEETTYLGVPCLTLRANTERPITVTHGTNRLIPDPAEIVPVVDEILVRPPAGRSIPPRYWDGRTADRIAQALVSLGC